MTYAAILAFIDAEIKFRTLHCKSKNTGNVESVNPNSKQRQKSLACVHMGAGHGTHLHYGPGQLPV